MSEGYRGPLEALPHRPLSLRHGVRMALARDRGDLVAAAVPAAVIPGATLPDGTDALATAQQATHDQVIAIAGDGRLTGVAFSVLTGADALGMLDTLEADVTPHDLACDCPTGCYQQLREYLTDPAYVLVVASVMVDARAPIAHLS